MARTNQPIAVANSACRGGVQVARGCRDIRSGYDIVRIAVACILLAAAGIKAHQLMTEPASITRRMESRWFPIAVVEFELFFALWLVLLSPNLIVQRFIGAVSPMRSEIAVDSGCLVAY